MSLRETINNRTGVRRYYVNGQRVTLEAMDAAKFWRRLDCFASFTRGHITRHLCEARS